MDWSFIDDASIIATALVATLTVAFVVGMAFLAGLRSVVGLGLIAILSVPLVLAGSKLAGLSAAPIIRAELHDFDAELERLPVVSKLVVRHPDMRQRLTRVMKIQMRGFVDPVDAQLAAQGIIESYLWPYFARTSDIAMAVYHDTREGIVAHLYNEDPEICRDYVNGYSPLPVHLLPEGYMDEVHKQIEQIIQHAILSPHEEPTRDWVETTFRKVFKTDLSPGDPMESFPELSCLEYLKLTRDAEKKLARMEYYRLLRGLISVAYRSELRES